MSSQKKVFCVHIATLSLGLLFCMSPLFVSAHEGHGVPVFTYGSIATKLTAQNNKIEVSMTASERIDADTYGRETAESLMTDYVRQHFEIKQYGSVCPLVITVHKAQEKETFLEGTFTCPEPVQSSDALTIYTEVFSDFFENYDNEVSLLIQGEDEKKFVFNVQNTTFSSTTIPVITPPPQTEEITPSATATATTTPEDPKQKRPYTTLAVIIFVLGATFLSRMLYTHATDKTV